MIDIKLDTTNHDITPDNMIITGEVEGIIQEIKMRLLFIKGEWFLNQGEGISYFESILKKKADLSLVETLMKQEILTSDKVKSILEFSLLLNNDTRTVSITFSCNTTLGEVINGSI